MFAAKLDTERQREKKNGENILFVLISVKWTFKPARLITGESRFQMFLKEYPNGLTSQNFTLHFTPPPHIYSGTQDK